ncbi:MAG: HDOD domain-containing protein [Desulfobacterales bacterium]
MIRTTEPFRRNRPPPGRAEQIIARQDAFPAMPGAVLRLLVLVEEPRVTAQQIEGVLRQDPGLTANMLRLANSAYFGLPTQVGSVRQAVMLLGLKRLTQTVVAACAASIMDRPVPGYDLPAGDLWRHSLAVSVAAEGLVAELHLAGAEEIFTAALLHDIGKIILGQFLQDETEQIRLALDRGLSFTAAEMSVLGTTHAAIGADVMAKWALPEPMIHAVRWHHAPEEAGAPQAMLDVVHVANMLCLMIGIGVGRDGLHHRPSPAVTRRLGLSTAHLEKVASHTLQRVGELSQTLDPGHVNVR